jgi:hypothetical protein
MYVNGKMKLFQEWGEGGMKNTGGGVFKYNTFDIL